MIRNKYIILLLGLVVLIGCRPKGIISSREMRNILIDLHKTDGLLQVCGYQHGYDETRNIYYAMVLEKHGITQAQFDSSLVWYTANPQLFDKIYPKVLAAIEEEKDQYYALHKAEFGPQEFNTNAEQQSSQPELPALTAEEAAYQVDSILWVIGHGYPSIWNPYPVKDLEPPFIRL